MKKRLISKEDCYSDGLIVVGKSNLAVGDNTHVEVDDSGVIVGLCKVEKRAKPATKTKAKKDA